MGKREVGERNRGQRGHRMEREVKDGWEKEEKRKTNRGDRVGDESNGQLGR